MISLKILIPTVSSSEPSDASESDHRDLLRLKSKHGQTLMHAACETGHMEIVHLLYERCPELVDVTTTDGRSPLHFASIKDRASVAKELCRLYVYPFFLQTILFKKTRVSNNSLHIREYTACIVMACVLFALLTIIVPINPCKLSGAVYILIKTRIVRRL